MALPELETGKDNFDVDSNGQLAGFLERCYYFKAKFKLKWDMYMFSYYMYTAHPKQYEASMTEVDKLWMEKLKNQAGN